MGRISARRPAGDGLTRSPGRGSDHPQDQRQILSRPPDQRRGQSGLREESHRFFYIAVLTAGQSVTAPVAPFPAPKWPPFSPPPTPSSCLSVVLRFRHLHGQP